MANRKGYPRPGMFVTLRMTMKVTKHFNSTLTRKSQISQLPSKVPQSKSALILVPQRTPSTMQHICAAKTVPLKPTNVKLCPYGEDNTVPIPLAGSFFGLINTPSGQTDLTRFLVLKAWNAGCLLSRETSTRLGMLHIAASTTTEHHLYMVNTSLFYRSSQQCLVGRSGN